MMVIDLEKLKTNVRKVLIAMAMEDEMPMDMNDLDIDEVFNIAQAIDTASSILCHEGPNKESIIEQLMIIRREYYENPLQVLDTVEGVQVSADFEYKLSVGEFVKHTKLVDYGDI